MFTKKMSTRTVTDEDLIAVGKALEAVARALQSRTATFLAVAVGAYTGYRIYEGLRRGPAVKHEVVHREDGSLPRLKPK